MAGETTLERRLLLVKAVPPPPAPTAAPAYYDISMLKPPVWGGDIAVYFFLGGLSAGAFILARAAERFGGDRYRRLTQAGTVIAALAAAPCAPLLIADLGDPKRFLNMLRVFKPHSPMNLGAWTLTAYTGVSVLALLREWLRGDQTPQERSVAANLLDGALVTVSDAAGVPLAILLAGYTGVLLSATATPVWSKNPWLGAMFTASAVNTGSAAISLALDVLPTNDAAPDEEAHKALQRIDTAAHAVEAITLMGFHASAGSLAEPLTAGKASLTFLGGAAAMTAAEVLKLLPLRGRNKRLADATSAILGLAGGLALRWSMVQAGPLSAKDPEAARQVSRPPQAKNHESHE
jgi:formate-dependent nitrite reductase membrane component NrfD